jgi:predicted dienelactone hydrolase
MSRSTLLAALVIFGLAVGSARSAEKAAYKPVPGPLSVETVDKVVLKDAKRNKELPVAVCFPKEAGVYPVIVFSHGAGGSGDRVLPLPRFWASHGYVCLMPTHADSLALRRQREKADPKAPGGKPPDQEATLRQLVGQLLRDPKSWPERPRDVSFLLDSLGELETRVPGLKGKMDARRIGVGGHSLGAFTAQVVGGATIQLPGEKEPRRLADPRVRAVLQLSGQGANQFGLTEQSWEKMSLPMMSMTGSLDRGARGQSPEWRMEPFKRSPAGDKYHVFIEGAHHGSFTGRLAVTGEQKAIFGYVQCASLAFWDAYLKQEEKARKYLQSDALVAAGKKALTLHRK